MVRKSGIRTGVLTVGLVGPTSAINLDNRGPGAGAGSTADPLGAVTPRFYWADEASIAIESPVELAGDSWEEYLP